MKKTIFGTLICVMLICVIVATFSFSAFAATDANIKDEDYYLNYVTAGYWVAPPSRYKTDTSRVYVAPEKSPTGYTKAQVRCRVGGTMTNVTTEIDGYVLLTDGTRYAIQNTAFQSGDYTAGKGVETWLYLSPLEGAGILSGVWSADWSGWTDNGQVKLV